MASVYNTYANLPSQAATKVAAISTLTTASLADKGTQVSADGLSVITRYAYETGNPAQPLEVTVRSSYDPKANVRHDSVRLSTYIEHVEDYGDSEVAAILPTDVVIAWNSPSRVIPDVASVSIMIQALFGLLMNSFDGTDGTPDTIIFDAINFGRTKDFWGA